MKEREDSCTSFQTLPSLPVDTLGDGEVLNAPTKLMKNQGFGKGYAYDHDAEYRFSGQNYFPDEMERQSYYLPVQRGFEREMDKRLTFFKNLRQKKFQ